MRGVNGMLRRIVGGGGAEVRVARVTHHRRGWDHGKDTPP